METEAANHRSDSSSMSRDAKASLGDEVMLEEEVTMDVSSVEPNGVGTLW